MRALPLTPLLLAAAALGQDRPTPEEQLQQKLRSPFLKAAAWTLDLDRACAAARARDQLVFGYFTTAGP